MKAVYLEKAGEALKVVDCPEPKLQPGGVIVKILTAPALSFMKRVVSGELGYAMAPPWIPGANGVGVVESIANDVGGLEPGDHVFIDPHAYTHTRTDFYDGILIGRFLKKLSGGRPLDRLLLREDKTREESMALRLLPLKLPGLHQLRPSLIRAFVLNLIAQIALGTPATAQVAVNSCRALPHIVVRTYQPERLNNEQQVRRT